MDELSFINLRVTPTQARMLKTSLVLREYHLSHDAPKEAKRNYARVAADYQDLIRLVTEQGDLQGIKSWS